ncbi:hypothetical protein TIFTF001_019669 [Ficus carica]|uniref:Uncharacterized protein n=1 Tax=Ficus carica TaxID=3494 RepID=A0AA88D946_FICCA|nr:hypothetical protein TIFTF001_019669 [Ficus carica]
MTGCRRSIEIQQYLSRFSCVSLAIPMPASGCSNGSSHRPRLVLGLTSGSHEGSRGSIVEIYGGVGRGGPRQRRLRRSQIWPLRGDDGSILVIVR